MSANAATASPAPRTSSTPGRVIAENVETLAIAVVMALILKYFLLEAYKIPTGSMQPTIMGDAEHGIFDRVLVNKMVYCLRDPRRFEVIVFRMPLVQRQNYIKRLIGLPGERIRISNGNVLVTPPGGTSEDERVARKPDSVWRSVRKKILPRPGAEADLRQHFQSTGDRSAVALTADTITVRAPERGEAYAELTQKVMDHYYDGYPEELRTRADSAENDVSDLEFAGEIEVQTADTVALVEIRDAHLRHQLRLDAGAGRWSLRTERRTDVRRPVDAGQPLVDGSGPLEGLRPGRSLEFSLRNVDEEVVVLLGGDEVGRFPYDNVYREDRCAAVRVAMGAEKGEARFEDLALWRDIHYTRPHGVSAHESYQVPPDSFFVLGDNTTRSYDGRSWTFGTTQLANGSVVRGNWLNPRDESPDANPRTVDRGTIEFQNLFGEMYRLPADTAFTQEEFHFVGREYLLGKAMAVFWPLPPMSPVWRLGWVR